MNAASDATKEPYDCYMNIQHSQNTTKSRDTNEPHSERACAGSARAKSSMIPNIMDLTQLEAWFQLQFVTLKLLRNNFLTQHNQESSGTLWELEVTSLQ